MVQLQLDEQNGSRVAIVIAGRLESVADALDCMADASHNHQCYKLLIPQAALPPRFFDLSTGLAGEVLQKFTNYGVKLAITGDFSGYSKSLQDFIYECNQGRAVFFLADQAAALAALHALPEEGAQ